jgi:hypothetical protein
MGVILNDIPDPAHATVPHNLVSGKGLCICEITGQIGQYKGSMMGMDIRARSSHETDKMFQNWC